MIRVACFSYNNVILSNFFHDDIVIDYFDDMEIIKYANYDFVVIIKDKNNVDLVKCLKYIKDKFTKEIYVLDKKYNDDLINEIFGNGAADYLLYPITNEYLIQKMINDYKKGKNLRYYQYKSLQIDFHAHLVMIDYEEIYLTKIEYDLLKLLVVNANVSLAKQEILKAIWRYESEDYRTVETHIKTLRKKLKQYKGNIITIWSYGYLFSEKQ